MSGKIFINYRRGDDSGFVQALLGRLEAAFAADRIFIDIDSIAPGINFVSVLNEQVAQCDLFLAVIGKGWIDARDDRGARRLDNSADFVRIEIASALEQGKRVIPILLGDAQMPRPEELPDNIKELAKLNAVRLTHARFKAEAASLVIQLKKIMESKNAALAQRLAYAFGALATCVVLLVGLRTVMEKPPAISSDEQITRNPPNVSSPPVLSPSPATKLPPTSPSSAMSDQQVQLIATTADRICGVVKDSGSATSAAARGAVKVELNGLASQLDSAGASGSSAITTEAYQGAVRNQIVELMNMNLNCKLRVFQILQEKIGPPAPAGRRQ